MVMTFVFATDDRSLSVFPTDAAACDHAEGIDVGDGLYLFFDDTGRPLAPVFLSPNKRGWLTVRSGTYRLEPEDSASPPLIEILSHVSLVEGELTSLDAIREHLTRR